MNIAEYLLTKFLEEESLNTTLLILLTMVLTLFQTNWISLITAKIIEGIHKNDMQLVFANYKYFIIITIVYIFLYYFYKYIQNNLLMKLIQWSKHEIFKIILTVNNENISNVNFVEFITPITRISMAFYVLFSNIISSLMPTVVFLMDIFAYFLYKNVRLGSFFLLGNICIFLYIAFFWNDMKEYKQKHEAKINDNEKYI